MVLNLLDSLEVFIGEATPAEARIYVRLAHTERSDQQWAGFVHGPSCAYSRTLPAQIPLQKKAVDSHVHFEAVIPDPCFWTPAMPFLYRVAVQSTNKGANESVAERTIGIRPLSVRGKRLLLEGKTWVLRGV